MTTPFTTLLAQLAAQPDGSSLTVTDDWTQGRTLFGGLANHAPADWMEQLAKADMSWQFDATGLI